MSDAEIPSEIAVSNERSLNTLARAIRLSLGQFSLILARCNYISLRDQMVQHLQQVSPVAIQELHLPPAVKTLYTTIRAELGEQHPQALMILGLESTTAIDQVLTSTNQIREEFRKSFSFPLVLWVNDDILQKLIHLAPDFKSWAATSIKFELDTPSLIQMLQTATDAMFAASLNLGTGRFLDNTSLNLLLGLRQTLEMEFAAKDLQNRDLALDPLLTANVQFLRGRSADAMGDRLKARKYYEQSLEFWLHECDQPHKSYFCLERRGCLLFYLGLWWRQEAVLHRAEYHASCLQAQEYYQQCVDGFLQGNRPDLAARFINALGEVLSRLELVDQLAQITQKAVQLHQQHSDLIRLAFSYGLMSEVALMRHNWAEAKQHAERALSLNDEFFPRTPEEQGNRQYYRNLYLLLLAQAKQHLDQIPEAITHLRTAKANTKPQNAPILYIRLLETLRTLYFQQGDYLEAFWIKHDQRSVEQQFGLRAFIGAGRLQPTQKIIHSFQPTVQLVAIDQSFNLNSEMAASQQPSVAQEIVVSGRHQDLQRLIERIYRPDRKLSIIYGQSGVGKSSLVRAGLVPALRQITIEARDILPILLDVYTDWEGTLRRSLSEALMAARGIEIQPAVHELDSMLEQLRQNTDRNLITVLIFDQFEEFFFVYRDRAKRRIFYQFLSQCLNLPFVKVVFSLREDYLHYLLEFNRLGSLEVINNNILDKEILYYLGNLSPEDAKSVIQSLTERSKVYLEASLIDKLVQDLSGDAGEVRPIELQIVCAQLETDRITTLEQYQQRGTQKELVARFLEGVIEDCGFENKNAAQLVLYFLTDENGTRPLKTRAELAADLSAETEKLDLILEILVASGLVFLLPEAPADRYQLVHDYLVNFIRQQQGLGLLEELQELRTKDKRSQAEIEQLRREKQLLAELAEAKEKQKKSENRLNLFFRYAFIGTAFGLFFQASTAITAVRFAMEASQQRAAAIAQRRQAEISQIDALGVSSTALLPEQPLEALLTSVQMGQLLQTIEQDKAAPAADPAAAVSVEIHNKSFAALQRTVAEVQERNRLEGHTDSTYSVSFHPTGQKLVSAGKDTSLRIWATPGNLLHAIPRAHTLPIRSVVFSPNGQQIASVSDDKTIKLWSAEGKPIRTLHSQRQHSQRQRVNTATFSPNSQQLATADAAGMIRIWQVSTGKLLKTIKGHTGAVNSINFNRDGIRLVSAGQDGAVKIWNRQTGKQLASLKQDQSEVYSAKFSPNGNLIASAGKDKAVRLWNSNGTSLWVLRGHSDEVRDVSFSPDSKILVSGSSDRTLKLWSVEGRLLNTLIGHTDSVYQVAFNPQGTGIASASHDKTVRLWDIPQTPQPSLTGHYDPVSAVSFSANGKLLVSGSYDRSIRLWSQEGKLLKVFSDSPSSVINVRFSPNTQYIASAHVDGTIRLWAANGTLLNTFDYPTEVYSVRFSPDSKTLIAGGLNGTVKRWSVEGQDLGNVAATGYGNTVFGLDFSPDGKTVAIASRDQGVRLWAKDKQIKELKGHTDEVYSVAFSQDSKQLVSASRDRTVRIWDVATGRLLKTLTGHTYAVQSAAFSPNGQTIASAGDDKTVKIWKVADGTLEKTLEGHTDAVTGISFSPNGNLLASSSADKTIRFWNTETLNFDQLLDRACRHIRDYLHTNAHFRGTADQTRCDPPAKPTQPQP